MNSGVSTTPRAGRREWIGLVVLALPCLLYAMDLTVLNLAIPELSRDLKPSSAQLLWIIDIYGFLVAGSLVTMGTLGDRIGRRRLLLFGAVAFGIGSVLAAFAPTAELLIVARALLGLAGATVAPSTLSLIRHMFHDPGQRTVAISVWITSYSVGSAIGPVLGGVLLEFFWWGSVFLLAVPVMLLLLVLGPRLLPEYRDPNAGRLDLISAGLSLTAVLAVIYGLKEIAQHGIGAWPLLTIAAGLVVALIFARRQTSLTDPLLDLRLFRVPSFSAALATNLLGVFAIFGAFVFTAQYLQLVRDLTPLEAGLWTLPSSVAFIAGSMLVPRLLRLARPAFVIAGGLLTSAAGLALLTQVDSASGMALVVTGSIVMALGLSPVFTLTTDLVVGGAPPERAGSASALAETGSELGGAVGIAVLGSIGTAIYRSQMEDGVPAGVGSEAAAAARETLGGAVAAAEGLPDPLAMALLETGRDAFLQGFHVTALIGALLMAGTAVLAALLLRNARGGLHAGDAAAEQVVTLDADGEVARAA